MKETTGYRMITSDFYTNVIYLLHLTKGNLLLEPKKMDKNVSEPGDGEVNPDEFAAYHIV
jgi:hypothetical protein